MDFERITIILMMVIYFKVQVQRYYYLNIHALDYVSCIWCHC